MKVLLVWPGVSLPGWNSLHTQGSSEATYTSHGYMSMSSVLKQRGHRTQLLDMRDCLGWAHFERCVAEAEYDIAAIGFISCDAETALKACSIMGSLHPGRPIIAGGIHLSALHQEHFPYVRTVVWGEGDYALADLVEQVQEGNDLPPLYQAEIIQDLDTLPFVDRDLFDGQPERDHPLLPGLPAPNITILTSRGCQYRCSYCNPSGRALFGNSLRERSVPNVIEELRQVRTRFGMGSAMLHSDIVGSAKWIEGFIEAFASEFGYVPFWCQLRADFICRHPELVKGLSDVGMYWVSLGTESGDDRILQFIHKGTTVAQNLEAAEILHRNEVNIFCNLIVGLPTETESEMRQTLEMAKKIRPAWWSANPFASFPGSDLYNYCVENDLLTDEFYSRTVFPFQRKIKGLDYGVVMAIRDEILTHKRPIYPPKKKVHSVGTNLSNPKLSIIMRTYNRPDMLRRAAESVLGQTFQDYELIIVDDGSTSPSVPPLLDELEARDPRVRTIRNAVNRDGHCILLNQGIDKARAQYIAFCDDDDTRYSNWASEMVWQLDHHPEWMFVICQSEDINSNTGTRAVARGVIPPNVDELYSHNWVDLGELMLRRQLFDMVGFFDERVHYGDDWELVCRLVRAKIPGGEYKAALCLHYVHPGGQLHTRQQAQRQHTLSIIQNRTIPIPYKVSVLWPDMERMEYSHRNVVAGVRDAVQRIPYVALHGEGNIRHGRTDGADLIMVVCPFLCRGTEMQDLRKKTPVPILAFHTEDPPAIAINQQHAQFVDLVSTNDASCENAYGDKPTFVCPSLGVNTAVVGPPRHRSSAPSWDMCIVGFAYDSRKAWLRTVKDFVDWKLLLVGRGWEEFSDQFTVWGDQPLNETMDLYAQTKIVCCVQRQAGELGMTHASFQTPARGYVEMYSGACVMIDDSRPLFPPYNKGEILPFRYEDPDHFLEQAHWALTFDAEREHIAKTGQQRAMQDFTYVARIRQLLLCVRSPRLNRRIA